MGDRFGSVVNLIRPVSLVGSHPEAFEQHTQRQLTYPDAESSIIAMSVPANCRDFHKRDEKILTGGCGVGRLYGRLDSIATSKCSEIGVCLLMCLDSV